MNKQSRNSLAHKMAGSLQNTGVLPSGFYMASHPSPPTYPLLAIYFLERGTDPGQEAFFMRLYQQFSAPRTPSSESLNHPPALIPTSPQLPDNPRPWKLPCRNKIGRHYQFLYVPDGEGRKEENFWYCSDIEQLGRRYPKLDLCTIFST